MGLPNYQVQFISCRTGDVQHILDASAVDDLIYSRVLNGVGSIAFSLDITNAYAAELQARGLTASLDDFIEIYRTSAATNELVLEETYLLRYLQRFRENNDERLAIGGYSLNHLLKRRVVDPDQDPFEAGGYSTKAGQASDVMREYTVQQAGSGAGTRAFPLFEVPALGLWGIGIGARLRHENLLDVLTSFSERGQCDFYVRRMEGRNLQAEMRPIGTDRRYSTNYPLGLPYLILDPLRGNLSAPSITFDRKDEENFIYALGQGQGVKRYLLRLGGDGVYDSPFNRIEFIEDVRNADKADALTVLTQARSTLKERQPKDEFTFTPTGVERGNTYREDWDLGDMLTAQWDTLDLELRVYGVEVSVSGTDEKITPRIRKI